MYCCCQIVANLLAYTPPTINAANSAFNIAIFQNGAKPYSIALEKSKCTCNCESPNKNRITVANNIRVDQWSILSFWICCLVYDIKVPENKNPIKNPPLGPIIFSYPEDPSANTGKPNAPIKRYSPRQIIH